MRILVTGGAGYIGSFMTKRLLDKGNEVVIIDNLERGHEEVLDKRAVFLRGNLLDKEFVAESLKDQQFDGVIHFAGFISMGESMENPYIYFQNNTFGTLNLIEELIKNNQNNIIFSSTAGVYGNPISIPIPEDHPKKPENPYGESKLMVEKILDWYQKTKGLNSIALRYFNAAGAALDGSMGEQHDPESHIIPNIMKAAIAKQPFNLFGGNYKTKDGTCVRDYIHVLDLVDAHILALEKLQKDKGFFTYNVGTGNGYSNKEVIEMVKKVTGIDFEVTEVERRPGDADELVADVSRIKMELNFAPQYSDLETIVSSAWKWHSKK
jgi:UDP-glucose 4-epimerase